MTNVDPLEEKRRAFEKEVNSNVFVIMRHGPEIPFAEIEQTIKETLLRYSLKAVLARDVVFHMQLWSNVRFCMENSRYAIAVFERIIQPEYNPNVSLEFGFILALRRPYLILKERSLQMLHTDITGQVYTSFDSHNVVETVATAIEKWLEKLGHSSIKPATIIATDQSTTPIEANKERTRTIVTELTALASGTTILPIDRIIRQEASLSSLAISDQECGDPEDDRELLNLLLQERNTMESLLKSGTTMRLVISPHVLVERVELKLFNREYVETDILPRYEQLISIIKNNLTNPNLQIVCAHRLQHQNLLIIGERIVFIGRKRVREKGFPYTTVIYDPTVILEEIHDFETLFSDITGAMLGTEAPKVEDYGSEHLKKIVIARLKASQREIKRKLGTLTPGKLSR
jgi:hypothetical protein